MTFALRSATVRFGHVLALDDVTVEVPGGSVVAVVGGDGAGKSTLLRALAGEVPLEGGTVEAPAKQHLGYLPASPGSWAALTVTQNIDFVAGIYGLTGDELVARRAELLDRASLTPAASRLAAQLSGGMRRKLGFVMAIVHRPALLILDEPSTGIDPVSRIDLWRLASEAAASGTAVLMSAAVLAGEADVRAAFQAARNDEYEEIVDKCHDFLQQVQKEYDENHFTYAELEENEVDLVKLRTWFAKVVERDAFGADLRAATEQAIEACEHSLEAYAARVYAEEAEGQ